MFTGIVQAVGEVEAVAPRERGADLCVRASAWRCAPTPGESICVAGACLTVAEALPGPGFGARFDVVRETLERTTLRALEPGDRVNLEPALRLDAPISGHLVQGHVDGVATVVALDPAPGDARLRLRLPRDLADLTPRKGSICVDGVSLTIADVAGDDVRIALIPETLARTTLGDLRVGDRCNVEVDYIARIIAHYLDRQGS